MFTIMGNRELIIFYVCGVAIILMFISYMIGITIYIGRLKSRLKVAERKDAAIDRIICFLDDNACINPRYRLDLLDLVYELKGITAMPVFEAPPAPPPQRAPALQEIRSYRGWYSSDGKMSYDDIVLIDHYENRRENMLNHARGRWHSSGIKEHPNLVMPFPAWLHVSMKYFYPCDMIIEISTMERSFSLKQDEKTGKFAPFPFINNWPVAPPEPISIKGKDNDRYPATFDE
jgi:hypothetical protein